MSPAGALGPSIVSLNNDRGSYTPDFKSSRRESQPDEIKETFNSLDSSSEDEDDALSYFQKLAE